MHTVGIISQNLVEQHHLRAVVEESICTTSFTYLIDHIVNNPDLRHSPAIENTDILLINADALADDQREDMPTFERWLFGLNKPIIFSEGKTFAAHEAEFSTWAKQLKAKIISAKSELSLSASPYTPANKVWVLAASTGGPEAVREFLDTIPAQCGLGFLYAQHIEADQQQALAKTITRSSHYHCRIAEQGDRITADTVMLVPSHQQVTLLADGTLTLDEHPWRGVYRPSIDQVIAMVATCFGRQSGVIFFSGMGDDGMAGARLMHRRGGQVWIQTPSSCVSDSMPKAIYSTGCVSTIGTPKQLGILIKKQLLKGHEGHDSLVGIG